MSVRKLINNIRTYFISRHFHLKRTIGIIGLWVGIISGIFGIIQFLYDNDSTNQIREVVKEENVELKQFLLTALENRQRSFDHQLRREITGAQQEIKDLSKQAQLLRRKTEVIKLPSELEEIRKRVRELVLTKASIELDEQILNHLRMALANEVGTLFSKGANLDPDSPDAQLWQRKVQDMQNKDKTRELQLRGLDTKIQSLETDIVAIQRVFVQKLLELGAY